MVERVQGALPHCGKQPIGGGLDAIARRCDELKLMIEKCNREKNFKQSRMYTERLALLQAGAEEEEYVWQQRWDLSTR